MFDNRVYVYNKKMELLATFFGDAEGISEEAMRELMVAPTVHIEQNGVSSLTFQMLASAEKWKDIQDPENIYRLNDRFYTALNDGAYSQIDENGVSIMNVSLLETWSLLSRQFNQAYNCGIYTYAKAKFVEYVTDGAKFTISAADCLNPGETISTQKAWEQVKAWTPTDDDGNHLSYAILTSDNFKPTNWKDTPSGVFMKSFTVSGNTATAIIQSRAKTKVTQVYQYDNSWSFKLDVNPLPSKIESVKINYTIVSDGTFKTDEKDITSYTYNASTGTVTVSYTPAKDEQINAVMITHMETDLGEISAGATCTFAYGAEAIDEHTFVILPKANKKYKLTIDGVSYEDSQVKDSRGVVMPRGSGGYAMWAALKNSGWTLGICDVIAKDFDPSIDYGCFNIESDMKDVLYNVQYIQQLYGGILDWDSEHKVLNYRAENDTDYQAYDDGFNRWAGYEFREGKNMTERPVVTYDNSLITRAYLLGYGNLNIKQVNDGKSYIDDFSYTDTVYEGYLEQPLIYDTRDEGGQKQLLYWGKKELAKQCRPRKSVSLSVTDVRTVEGMEHEVFDIHDVVRIRYRDELTGEEVVEDKRITLWEYNAFAMEDCSIEVGDTTQNLTELFKLVYNKSLKSPDTNNSGNISSNNIHMNGIGWGGNGDSWFGSGSSDSLTRYIELIAQTSTKNSDAIAGLILDTSAIHSQVDLFALYQKQTDNLFTQSYAGLQLYADEKSAEATLSANHYSESLTQALDGSLTQKIVQTEASLKTYADNVGSRVEATATGYYETLNSALGTLRTQTQAGLTAVQNEQAAMSRQFASFQQEINGELRETKADIIAYADRNYASASMMAQLENQMASLEATVGPDGANLIASVKDGLAYSGISIDKNEIEISSYRFVVDSAYTFFDTIWVDGEFNCTGKYGNMRIYGEKINLSRIWLTDGDGNKKNFDIVTWG